MAEMGDRTPHRPHLRRLAWMAEDREVAGVRMVIGLVDRIQPGYLEAEVEAVMALPGNKVIQILCSQQELEVPAGAPMEIRISIHYLVVPAVEGEEMITTTRRVQEVVGQVEASMSIRRTSQTKEPLRRTAEWGDWI